MKEGKKTHLSIVVFVRSDKIEVKYYNENTYFDKKKKQKKKQIQSYWRLYFVCITGENFAFVSWKEYETIRLRVFTYHLRPTAIDSFSVLCVLMRLSPCTVHVSDASDTCEMHVKWILSSSSSSSSSLLCRRHQVSEYCSGVVVGSLVSVWC